MTWHVYALREPGVAAISYIGKAKDPGKRIAAHRSRSGARRVLYSFATEQDALLAERRLIATTPGLLNSGKGGERVPRRGNNPFPGLGKRLRARRKELGLKTTELAERSGVQQPSISRAENGQREDLTAYTAVRLARVLGCTVEWLVTGEDPGAQS